jgi:hypothetical protein
MQLFELTILVTFVEIDGRSIVSSGEYERKEKG